MEHRKIFILNKLAELEKELKNLELWSSSTLTEEQKNSSAPFGCDLMDFHEWLQHILIPKLRLMIQENQSLPATMDTASMAEYVYRSDALKYQRLIVILKTLDRSVKSCG